MTRTFYAALGLLVALTGCSKRETWYTTTIEIERVAVVHHDEKGQPLDVDVEFSYPDCPGEQVEIIRGSAEFARCLGQRAKGARVPVKILYHLDKEGFHDWDVHEMAGCPRPPDAEDEASFDTVQECQPLLVNGVTEGFKCDRVPQQALLKACPWFNRR